MDNKKLGIVIAVLGIVLALLLVVVLALSVLQKPDDVQNTIGGLNIQDGTTAAATETTAAAIEGETTVPEATEATSVETLPEEGEGDLFEGDGDAGPSVDVDIGGGSKPTTPTQPSDKPTEPEDTTKPTEGEGDQDAETQDPEEPTADFIIDFDDLIKPKP